MITHFVEGAEPAKVGTVSELRDLIQARFSPEYTRRMLHLVPDLEVLKERQPYLADKAKGRIVLDIGCTGPLARSIKADAAKYYGIDKEKGEWTVLDLDEEPQKLPKFDDVNLVMASEVLEHLCNPGNFLRYLSSTYPKIETYFTVPNVGAYQIVDGCEMVNQDHVAWYSYTTICTLLDKYGYKIEEAFWYNGKPHKAEGLLLRATAG